MNHEGWGPISIEDGSDVDVDVEALCGLGVREPKDAGPGEGRCGGSNGVVGGGSGLLSLLLLGGRRRAD